MTIPSSGTFQFQLSNFSVIKQSLNLIGEQISTVAVQDLEFARNSINLIFTNWSAQGYDLFNVVSGVINLTQGQQTVTLPTNIFDMIDCSIRTSDSGQPIDAPLLNRISVQTYQSFPDKTSQATPTMYYLYRGNAPSTAPVMYLYPVPDGSQTYQLSYFAITQMQDFSTTSGTQAPGIPYRWMKALVNGLAVELALYKNKESKYPILVAEYEKAFRVAAAGDADISGLEIIVDLTSTRRFT